MTMKLGTCLSEVTYYDTQFAFLNFFKQATTWGGNTPTRWADYQGAISVNAQGYPNSFSGIGPAAGQTFTTFDNAIWDNAQLPSGQYVFLWGGGTSNSAFSFTSESASISQTYTGTSRILLSVGANPNGIRVHIGSFSGGVPGDMVLIWEPTGNASAGVGGSTTPGTNGTGTREALYNSGEIFNPDFIAWFGSGNKMDTVRFHKWNNVVANGELNWSDRTTPDYFSWAPVARPGNGAVPWEVCIALCNKIGAHAWLNMPMMSNDTYISNLATLVLSGGTDALGKNWAGLNASKNVLIEYGNEIWNINAISGGVIFGTANIAYPYNPPFKSSEFVGTGSVSGTTLTITAVTSGTVFARDFSTGHNDLRNSIWDDTNVITQSGIGVTTQTGGTPGGIGTYTLSSAPGTITSTTIRQGGDFNAIFYYAVIRAVQNGATFKSVWGGSSSRVKLGIGSQTGNGSPNNAAFQQAVLSYTNSSFFSGTAGSHADFMYGAGYWGNANLYNGGGGAIPDGCTLDLLFEEIFSGGSIVTDPVNGIAGGYTSVFHAGISGTIMTVNSTTGNTIIYPGMVITSGAAAGTTVLSANSGGATWNVSISQTVASGTAMTGTGGFIAQAAGWTFLDWQTAQSPSFGNGIPLYVYEGGQTMIRGTSTQQALIDSAMLDSRMYTAYANTLTLAQTGNVQIYENFTLINYGNAWWGVEIGTYSSPTYRWNALNDFLGGAGPSPPAINLMGQACL